MNTDALQHMLDAIPNESRLEAEVAAILRMRPLSDWNKLTQTVRVFCTLYPSNHATQNLARAVDATTMERLDIIPELKLLVSEISAYECETYHRFGLDGSLDDIHPDDLLPQSNTLWDRIARTLAGLTPWSKA